MNASDTIGYVDTEDQNIFCVQHGRQLGVEVAIFATDESDTPWHCEYNEDDGNTCDAIIPVRLTDDGVEYVREALLDNQGRPEILAEWQEQYKEVLGL